MENLTEIQKNLLQEIADLHNIPEGAISLRIDGKSAMINSTAKIIITPKPQKNGIDILIKKNTQNQSLHIPVIIAKSGIKEVVLNDFEIQDNCDITIVAGCGIYNCSASTSEHNGIHTFNIGKNCKVQYIEKHLGIGTKNNNKNLSPKTIVNLGENSVFEMYTTQIGGVDFANRETTANIKNNAKFIVKEKILTDNKEQLTTKFVVNLDGNNSKAEIISRAVAKNNSSQSFESKLIGNNSCFGRVECDGIVLNNSKITSLPAIIANNSNASLSHEANVGKIAQEELIRLMTLGLSEQDAENKIIEGYLK